MGPRNAARTTVRDGEKPTVVRTGERPLRLDALHLDDQLSIRPTSARIAWPNPVDLGGLGL